MVRMLIPYLTLIPHLSFHIPIGTINLFFLLIHHQLPNSPTHLPSVPQFLPNPQSATHSATIP